ncbi:hypothetical protein GCM10008967_27510 [Bacillus carboniphilus]|uniref:Uncharacterized protein n=1 Tax=Bacillus carboniphilus TaxID=86663 RepID=A0ABN0WF24_9BACI
MNNGIDHTYVIPDNGDISQDGGNHNVNDKGTTKLLKKCPNDLPPPSYSN